MTKVKSRGKDTPSPKNQPQGVDTEKFLNVGQEVDLSTGETWRIRDIPFDAWLTGFADLIPVLMTLSESGMDDTKLLGVMMKNEQVRKSAYYLASQAAQVSPDQIAALSLRDALKVIIALKKVVNFAEVKELFTQAGLSLTLHSTEKRSQIPADN